jgi:hypothetical protein
LNVVEEESSLSKLNEEATTVSENDQASHDSQPHDGQPSAEADHSAAAEAARRQARQDPLQHSD